MQMETGKPVASGTMDMSHHRALGQSLLVGFFGGLLWVGLTHFLETILEVPPSGFINHGTYQSNHSHVTVCRAESVGVTLLLMKKKKKKSNTYGGSCLAVLLGQQKERERRCYWDPLVCLSYCKWSLVSNRDPVSSSACRRGSPEALQALLTWLPAKGWHELGRNGIKRQAAISNPQLYSLANHKLCPPRRCVAAVPLAEAIYRCLQPPKHFLGKGGGDLTHQNQTCIPFSKAHQSSSYLSS